MFIDELSDYGCSVDAYDPWVDKKDVDQKNFAFITDPFQTDKKYDAVIAAVGHKVFAELDRSEYESISTEEAVLINIKGVIEDPTWRL
ncbi:MAG: UDP binding domain-containing protein [Campylobacterota bacterium]|nr:UDP binding domain-containing protein [Campylobacterota bacterium]